MSAIVYALVGYLGMSSPPPANPFPSDVMSWNASTKAAQRSAADTLLGLIRSAEQSGSKVVVIPKKDYRFEAPATKSSAHLVLQKLKDLTIDFQGSTLWFESEASGILLSNCTNVTLKNVYLDWDPLPFIQGSVVSLSKETFDVRVDSGYEKSVAAMGQKKGTWRGFVFDPSSREFKTGQDSFNVNFNANKNPDGTYRVRYRGFRASKLADSGMQRGDLVVLLARMGRAVRVESSEACVLEDMTLYSAPFVAFVDANGNGNTYRRCRVIRRPGTNRLIAGNADGINVSNNSKGPIIDSCQLEFLGDDFVNIHGHFSRVLEQTSPTELITTRIGKRPSINSPVTLQFYDRATMRPLGTRKVTAVPIQYRVQQSKIIMDLDKKAHSGEAATLEEGQDAAAHRVKLDSPISITKDTVIFVESFSSSGAVIRNSTFHGGVSRGIRLQSPNARIEGNKISSIGGPGLTMMGSGSYWGEGPFVHSTSVTGNTFTDTCMFAPKSVEAAAVVIREEGDFRSARLSRDIILSDNTFVRTGGAAIIARGVDNLTIIGNRISQDNNRRVSAGSNAGTGSAIILDSIRDLVMRDNQVSARGQHASGQQVAKIDVTDR